MKKRISALFTALVLCVGLAAPASAYTTGTAGEGNELSTGGAYTALIDGNGTLWVWGLEGQGERWTTIPVAEKKLEDVTAVSCGRNHTAAIKTDGTLWTWGNNKKGALGDGGTTARVEPVQVMENVAAVSCGEWFTAAVKTDGTLWTWGENTDGQLGRGDSDYDNHPTPEKVMEDVAAVSCGGGHMAVIKTDGSLWVWGTYFIKKATSGTWDKVLTPQKVLDDAAAVSCGMEHTAAVKKDGSLWMWGVNTRGQLGNNTVEDYTKYKNPDKVLDGVAAVSCGWEHTAAVKTDGSLWLWGENRYGQMGNGGKAPYSDTPEKVMEGVDTVSCGGYYTLARKTDGTLWAWGDNSYGQLCELGETDEAAILSAGEVSAIQTVPAEVSFTLGQEPKLDMIVDFLFGEIIRGGVLIESRSTGIVELSDRITALGSNVFMGKTDVTEVVIPESVVRIGTRAFKDCADLTKVNVPESVTEIGKDAFSGCPATIYAPAGSFAERYAKENGIPFQAAARDAGTQEPGNTPESPAVAHATSYSILVDGKAVNFDAYALRDADGNDTNYLKLRDLAFVLSGTPAQFNVGYDGAITITTGAAYDPVGTEMSTPFSGDRPYGENPSDVLVDGVKAELAAITLTDASGGGFTYFKLRDLGEALGFSVDWDSAAGAIVISTT